MKKISKILSEFVLAAGVAFSALAMVSCSNGADDGEDSPAVQEQLFDFTKYDLVGTWSAKSYMTADGVTHPVEEKIAENRYITFNSDGTLVKTFKNERYTGDFRTAGSRYSVNRTRSTLKPVNSDYDYATHIVYGTRNEWSVCTESKTHDGFFFAYNATDKTSNVVKVTFVPRTVSDEDSKKDSGKEQEAGKSGTFAGTYTFSNATGTKSNGSITLMTDGTWSYTGNKSSSVPDGYTVSGSEVTLRWRASGYDTSETFEVSVSGSTATWRSKNSSVSTFFSYLFGVYDSTEMTFSYAE